MRPQVQKAYRQGKHRARRSRSSLPALLWMLWTIVVIATSYLSWHADVAAQRPLDLLGLVVHCSVVGVIGLVVLTIIEIHLEPWRFLDE
jgi:hypothetical protein